MPNIDDIFMLWPHSITDLMNFITALNSYYPLIKFPFEHIYKQITFLDVNVFKGPNFHITNKLDVKTHNNQGRLKLIISGRALAVKLLLCYVHTYVVIIIVAIASLLQSLGLLY